MPVTVKPARANSTARGSPTYPSPTTPTRARRVRIFPAKICAVAPGKVSSADSVMALLFSHSARQALPACQRFELVHPADEFRAIRVAVLLRQQFAAGALQNRDQVLQFDFGGVGGRNKIVEHRFHIIGADSRGIGER